MVIAVTAHLYNNNLDLGHCILSQLLNEDTAHLPSYIEICINYP